METKENDVKQQVNVQTIQKKPKQMSSISILIIVIIVSVLAIGVTAVIRYKETIGQLFKFEWLTSNTQEDETLRQVADAINNLSSVKEYITSGVNIKADVKNNILLMTIHGNEYEYVCENQILQTKASKDDMVALLLPKFVITGVAQLSGIDEQDMYIVLNSFDSETFKLENGFEILEDDTSETIRIALNSKFVLPDVSNEYIKMSDLLDYEHILEIGSLQLTKGYVTFYEENRDKQVVITIGEKNSLTQNAYKSLLNGIEVFFGKDEVENFSNQMPELINKKFGKYKVEINPELTSLEKYIFSVSYKVVRVTIDK